MSARWWYFQRWQARIWRLGLSGLCSVALVGVLSIVDGHAHSCEVLWAIELIQSSSGANVEESWSPSGETGIAVRDSPRSCTVDVAGDALVWCDYLPGGIEGGPRGEYYLLTTCSTPRYRIELVPKEGE